MSSLVRRNINVTPGQVRTCTPFDLVTDLVRLLKSIPDSVFPQLPPINPSVNTTFADLLSQSHVKKSQMDSAEVIEEANNSENVAVSAGIMNESEPIEDSQNANNNSLIQCASLGSVSTGNEVNNINSDAPVVNGENNEDNDLEMMKEFKLKSLTEERTSNDIAIESTPIVDETMAMDPMMGSIPPTIDVSSLLDPQLVEEMGQLITQIRQCFTPANHQTPNGANPANISIVDIEEESKILSAVIKALYSTDCVYLLIKKLPAFDFERRKLVTQIITALIKRNMSGTLAENIEELPLADYCFVQHPDILSICLDGYRGPIPLCYGSILRESVARWEKFTAKLLTICNSEKFLRLFAAMNSCHFDVSSDASLLFKDMMTRHRRLVSDYLKDNFDTFFGAYECLVLSVNYATRRSSIKLLSEILLSRSNFSVMTRYISKPSHLKLVMCLLKDPSAVIRGEVFHIFKVFVANPKKTPEIVKILARNKERLIAFLRDFNKDRDNNDMANEKLLLMHEISKL